MKVVSLTKIKEVENELINNLLNCNQEIKVVCQAEQSRSPSHCDKAFDFAQGDIRL